MPSLRFADPRTVTQYPLEIASAAHWQPAQEGWLFSIDLGGIAAGDMIAPSLSVLDPPDLEFQFVLEADGIDYPLAVIPPRPEAVDQNPAETRRRTPVRTAIDCFHIDRTVKKASLHCRVRAPNRPQRYLLTMSVRPTEISVPPVPELPAAIAGARPSTVSQMLQNPRIAARVCSPVSTAMVLEAHGRHVEVSRVIADCHDPVTGMYGLWPLAVRSAAGAGMIGAVELFAGWTPALTCLAAGLPLIASIRYGAGELPGAPLNATGGHLVVVYGVDHDQVLVHDPAAPHHGSVSRRYPLQAFSNAWFRHRGAVYILCP